jgi:nucleotide-binding universal stress UspA family protein
MEAPIAPPGGAEDIRADHAKSGDDPPTREVIVGVDGSEVGLGAVRWAAQEAARRGAPLRILHAAPYLGRGGTAGAPPPELPRARGITSVAYTVARHTEPGVQSTTEVVTDDALTALTRAAATGQLVVLGSSATGAADEMVLAKLTARVAAHSPAPVIVVPRRRGGEPTDRPVVAVLGVGEPADDDAAATFAATAAQRLGVSVSVLQTRASRSGASHGWVDDLSAWAERFPDLEVSHSDLPAARANQVLGEACPSPLMVISAGHGTLLHRSLDGPHLWLLRHCTSPMALVPSVRRTEHGSSEETAATG